MQKNGLLLVTQNQKPAHLADLKGAPYVIFFKKVIVGTADAKISEKYPDLFEG